MKKTYNLPEDVVKHLEKKDNMSAYLARLVHQDMDKDYLESKIKLIIRKMKREENSEQK